MQDLTAHDCVSFDLFSAGDMWRFGIDGAETAVPIRPRLTVSTAEAAVDAAIAGLGATRVLSYQIEAALRAGELMLILEAFERAPIPVSFVYANQDRLPLKLRALLDFSAPRLRTHLQMTEAILKPVRRTKQSKRVTTSSVSVSRLMSSIGRLWPSALRQLALWLVADVVEIVSGGVS